MGLRQNGFRDNVGVFGFAGAGFSNGAYPSSLPINMHRSGPQRNITAGEGITDDKVGIPQGAKHPIAWVMPQKAGGLSSHNLARGSCTATLLLVSGRNIAGTSAGTSTAGASLQLVVSMQGTAAGIATATGNIVAALAMAGSAAGSCTASATIQALAWAYGTAAGTSTATLTRYATGRLYGSITPFTELSPESLASSVWAAVAADNNDVGTMGEKLNDAGSASNPWTEVIETGFTAAEILRLIASVTAGKVSGGGTGTEVFRDLGDTKDRITATVDSSGNRTAITRDAA